jgi:hypothetical protein
LSLLWSRTGTLHLNLRWWLRPYRRLGRRWLALRPPRRIRINPLSVRGTDASAYHHCRSNQSCH